MIRIEKVLVDKFRLINEDNQELICSENDLKEIFYFMLEQGIIEHPAQNYIGILSRKS